MLSRAKWNVHLLGPVLFCAIIRPLETSEMQYPRFLSQSDHVDLVTVGAECYCCSCSHSNNTYTYIR